MFVNDVVVVEIQYNRLDIDEKSNALEKEYCNRFLQIASRSELDEKQRQRHLDEYGFNKIRYHFTWTTSYRVFLFHTE